MRALSEEEQVARGLMVQGQSEEEQVVPIAQIRIGVSARGR